MNKTLFISLMMLIHFSTCIQAQSVVESYRKLSKEYAQLLKDKYALLETNEKLKTKVTSILENINNSNTNGNETLQQKYNDLLANHSKDLALLGKVKADIKELEQKEQGYIQQVTELETNYKALQEDFELQKEIITLQRTNIRDKESLIEAKDMTIGLLLEKLEGKDKLLEIAYAEIDKLKAENIALKEKEVANEVMIAMLSAPRVNDKKRPVRVWFENYPLDAPFVSIPCESSQGQTFFNSTEELKKLVNSKYFFEEQNANGVIKYRLLLEGICSAADKALDNDLIKKISLSRAEALKTLLVNSYGFDINWIVVKVQKKQAYERKVDVSYTKKQP